MSNDDLDTLRPEVRCALGDLSYIAQANHTGQQQVDTIRAELLRFAVAVTELHKTARTDYLRAEHLQTEFEHQMGRANRAEAELAALKARIADGWLCGVSNDKCSGNFDAAIYCLPSRFRGKRVRLMVVEE